MEEFSDADVLVRVRDVSKKFCRSLKRSLLYGVGGIFSELSPFRENGVGSRRNLQRERLRADEFWALENISFELRRGECLGLIGRNGAGKTTLLRMLNGLIKPDRGRIEVSGRVGGLIALSAGFNPLLSGRENIYISGSLRGASKREMDARIDEIIAFAELGDFIDMPVQSYSAGMQVRLGFSVAVDMKPDVLLVDEVLAVGDAGFRQKAYNVIAKLIESSAVIFVSHSITQVAKVCNRGLLLGEGRARIMSHDLREVIDGYFNEMPENRAQTSGSGRARLLEAKAYDESGECVFSLASQGERPLLVQHGRAITLAFLLEVEPEVGEFNVGLSFSDMELRAVAQCSTINAGRPLQNRAGGINCLRVTIPNFSFNTGKFSLTLTAYARHPSGISKGDVILRIEHLLDFQVSSEALLFGAAPVQLEGQWQMVDGDGKGAV